MAIVPDTKNWTWVLERPCPECGFDASSFPYGSVARELRLSSAAWRPLLMRQDALARPGPATWSTLEYGCHVRDVFTIFDGRLVRMLQEDDPLFENWDQDETAVAGRYGEQAPARVADELETAGGALADPAADGCRCRDLAAKKHRRSLHGDRAVPDGDRLGQLVGGLVAFAAGACEDHYEGGGRKCGCGKAENGWVRSHLFARYCV